MEKVNNLGAWFHTVLNISNGVDNLVMPCARWDYVINIKYKHVLVNIT